MSLHTIRNRLTFLSQPLTRCVSRNGTNNTSNKKYKTSFFEWFEVKVCILKSEAVINDQNSVLFFGTPCIAEAAKVAKMEGGAATANVIHHD